MENKEYRFIKCSHLVVLDRREKSHVWRKLNGFIDLFSGCPAGCRHECRCWCRKRFILGCLCEENRVILWFKIFISCTVDTVHHFIRVSCCEIDSLFESAVFDEFTVHQSTDETTISASLSLFAALPIQRMLLQPHYLPIRHAGKCCFLDSVLINIWTEYAVYMTLQLNHIL